MHKHALIEAAAPAAKELLHLTGDVKIEAAAADGKAAPRRFDMVAYTGGKLFLANFDHPVVVDLEGVSGTEKSRPIFKDHNKALVVGHSDRIGNDGRQLTASGVVSGTGPAAKEVVGNNDNGFPWQASIGARPLATEFVTAGRRVTVNGQTFEGPVIVARRTRLNEISFVALGADDQTSARIAANAAAEGTPMTFEQWLASKEIAADGLSDAVKNVLRAQYDAEIKATADDGDDADDDGKKGKGTKKPAAKKGKKQAKIEAAADDDQDDDEPVNLVAEQRALLVAERKRVGALAKIEAQYEKRVPAEKFAEITAKAIEDEWDADKLELELIRAERPTARNGGSSGGNGQKLDAQVIEAAMSLSAGVPEKAVAGTIEATAREKVMNLALSPDMRGYGLHTLMDAIIHASGQHYGGSRKSNGYIRAALQAEQMINAAGFTSLSLSGVLSNVANKGLIAAYTAVEVIWNKFCAVRNHGDFKVHTRYRMDSTGAFKKVGADGELKHIGLSDSSYTNQLGTFGAIISLTRQMMINDDLGAFMDIPAMLGRLAALRIEEAAFVLLLSNPSSFFGTANSNYVSGASSALSITSVTTAEQKFRDQVDGNSKPVLVSPKTLLTGSGLAVTAENLFAEKLLIADGVPTTAASLKPNRNPHAGKYPPITSPYVNNTAIKDQDGTAITGQSSTAWWLFADPVVRAAIAVAFLNGQQTPTIESAQTDFNTLGMQWRGYHDFGVGLEDPKAAVLSAGA